MGISASQARLLSITARLTSNEYESQQISNAKMRLATKSEQASNEYIAALNTRQLQFVTYDAQGQAITEALTANALYQYSDMKNQYALLNANGQAMVSTLDAKNFEKAANLTEFLALYGVEKTYKTESLAKNAQLLETDSNAGGVGDYLTKWEEAIDAAIASRYPDDAGNEGALASDERFQLDKAAAFYEYGEALSFYEKQVTLYNSGVNVDISGATERLSTAKQKYSDTITFDKWVQSKAYETSTAKNDGVYENSMKYYEVLEEFLAEAEDLGCTNVTKAGDNGAFKYNDATKAQWYTNLWYKMNGASSDKSVQGNRAANYTVLDPKLAASKDWLQDALEQGIISIEVASYKDASNLVEDESRPLTVKLQGISWTPTEYGSCIDFTEVDDEAAIAKAEAEYQKKNNEISAKDKRYQSKIKTLDTEHNALQTQYESVKSAMTKNIDRSFKTFSG
ncbi:hypothetical protein J6A34_03620 [bacterium]|nr:hypothetical protein [bacterium]